MKSSQFAQGRKILIINPNRGLAKELERALTTSGYAVTTAFNWNKGLQAALKEQPELVCIDADVKNQVQGLATARRLWEEQQLASVILVDPATVLSLDEAGFPALAYLVKPFDEERLECTIHIALNTLDEQRKVEAEKEQVTTEMQQLRSQLFQAQRMEIVGAFTAGIAHDFNNILLPIMGNATLLSEALTEAPKLKAMADEIQHAGQTAASLTRQLLAFSRRGEHEEKLLDLNKIVKSSKGLIQRLFGEEYSLELDLESETIYCSMDEGDMEQILLNLCVNARDAMDPGGKVTLRTRKLSPDEEAGIRPIHAKVNNDWLCLTVRDTGCGMTRETLEHLFEAFYSTKSGENTGLGLSVVHGIVSKYDGHIEVSSELGAGSEFRIYLPLQTAEENEAGTVETPRQMVSSTGNERILFIEDEAPVREFVTKALANRGYEISTAVDIDTAKQLFRQTDDQGRSPYDLVISDCVLPDGNGAEFLQQQLVHFPGLKVILTTGYAEGDSITEALRHENVGFLQKPFPLAKLFNLIRELLDGEVAEAC